MIAHAITEIILVLCIIVAVLYAAYCDLRARKAIDKAFQSDERCAKVSAELMVLKMENNMRNEMEQRKRR